MNVNQIEHYLGKYSGEITSDFELVSEGARDIIWFWDFSRKEILLSSRWKHITGYDELILEGTIKKILSFTFKEDKKSFLADVVKILSDQAETFSSAFRIRLKNGKSLWVLCSAAIKRNEAGTITAMGGSLGDISNYKSLEEKHKHIKNFDLITGLPKFRYIFERLMRDKKRAQLLSHKGAAFFIDLDNYRKVNNAYGLDVGNELLRSIVEKIKHYIREKDAISRIDGDEFLLLLSDTDGKEAAKIIARRIQDIFKQPFYIFGHEIFITASIGIILTPGIYKDYFELFQRGNSAIYEAKNRGRNQYRFFEEVTNEKLIQRYNMGNDLRRAILQNEFVLFFQPVVNANTGNLKGLEALIRWHHPHKGIIPPLDFIPIAEESELIVPIGNWVLETACLQNKLWQNKGYPHIFVAVNVSAHQLQHRDFFDRVYKALINSKLEAKYLELEITESAWMASMETASQTLLKLKAMGVRISLDDFGTHYSSLSYLKYFPIDKIKIDKSFIGDINKDFKNESIISAIITLSQKMKIELVAEGVEKCEQLDYLRQQGCELIQGYLYSKPLPSVQIEEFVKRSEIKISSDCFNYYQI